MVRRSPHHNIFFAFKSASRDAQQRIQQLEDNLTRALICTLDLGGEPVARAFLELAGVRWKGGEPVRTAMQVRMPRGVDLTRRAQRVLLGIVPPGVDPSARADSRGPADPDADYRALPDAWVWGAGYAVLVESKIVGKLDADQMNSHLDNLTGGQPTPAVVQRGIRWSDVHRCMIKVGEAGGLEPAQALIVAQLIAFLELTNMCEFTGFNAAMFDYFHRPDDPEMRAIVSHALDGFTAEVRAGMAGVDPWYQAAHGAVLATGATDAWRAFGAPRRRSAEGAAAARVDTDRAHQTFAISAESIVVKVNVELLPAVKRLRGAIARDQQALRGLLVALQDGWTVQVQGMVQDLWPDPAQRPPWARGVLRYETGVEASVCVWERRKRQAQKYDYYPLCRLDLRTLGHPDLGQAGLDYLVKVIQDVQYPYITVQLTLPRVIAEPLAGRDQGAALVRGVLAMMGLLHPLVAYANGAAEVGRG